jgi:hypothetical protein
MSVAKRGVRVGAAAFVLGLSLAGAGAASADTSGGDGADTSSAATDDSGAAGSPARAGRASRGAAVRQHVVGSARPVVSASPAAAAVPGAEAPAQREGRAVTVTPAGVDRGLRGAVAAPASPTPSVPSSGAVVSPASPSSGSWARSSAPAVETATPAAVVWSVSPPAAAAVAPLVFQAAPSAAAAAPALARPALNVVATLNTAITNWFDSTAKWLSGLPAGPVRDLVSGGLLLIRRSLFNQLPTAVPNKYLTTSSGEFEGTVGAVDQEGDPLTYSLAEAPQYGTVRITADGIYTYTPGPDYAGADVFTVAVTSPGFNLLQPFGTRQTLVTVNVPCARGGGTPGAAAASANSTGAGCGSGQSATSTRSFTVQNLTGSPVKMTAVLKEPGYEDDLLSGPPDYKILLPGDEVGFDLTYYVFYTFDTRAVFETCAANDPKCGSGTTGSPWTVNMRSGSGSRAYCETGDCSEAPGDPDQLSTGVALLDPEGTANTLVAGPDADRVKVVLSQLCNKENTSAKCKFEPVGEQTKFLRDYTFLISQTNRLTTPTTIEYNQSKSVGSETNVSVEASVTAGFFSIVEAGFTASYGKSYSQETSVGYSTSAQVDPGQTVYLYVQNRFTRTTGTFTAEIGNTTWTIEGATFDVADPDGGDNYLWSPDPR